MEPITLILATYAVTLVFVKSEGPFGSLYRLRQNEKVDNFGLLNCFMCTAFWIALIVCLIAGRLDLFFISWGSSIIIDKVAK